MIFQAVRGLRRIGKASDVHAPVNMPQPQAPANCQAQSYYCYTSPLPSTEDGQRVWPREGDRQRETRQAFLLEGKKRRGEPCDRPCRISHNPSVALIESLTCREVGGWRAQSNITCTSLAHPLLLLERFANKFLIALSNWKPKCILDHAAGAGAMTLLLIRRSHRPILNFGFDMTQSPHAVVDGGLALHCREHQGRVLLVDSEVGICIAPQCHRHCGLNFMN